MSPSDYSWLPGLLQSADPLFPVGSYAHSYGLEEMAAMGRVSGSDGLADYLRIHVYPGLERLELPYLRFAYSAFLDSHWSGLVALDEELGAAKLSRETRDASAAQGRQRLRLLGKLRPGPELVHLERLRGEGLLAPHHALIYACESALNGAPLSAALAAWAYQTLAAPCAAALKIIRIGQEGAQAALTAGLADLPRIVENSLSVKREYAGAFEPLLDIARDRHERAFSRLFIS